MMQTNLDRLYLLSFLAIHLFLSLSLFAPLQPLPSLTLPFRPLLFLLSLTAFLLSILPLILFRRWSITDSKLAATLNKDVKSDIVVAGITLRYGSVAAHYYTTLCHAKTGVVVVLYALSGLFLAASHGLGLMIYSSDASTWTPYQSVSFRDPQGLRVSSFRPNERLFFLLGSTFVLGALYSLHKTISLSPLSDSDSSPLSAPTFEPQATVESLGGRLSGKLRRRLPKALLVGSVLPGVLLAIYLSIRRPLFRLILSAIGHNSAIRPILIPSFRHYFLSPGLVFRTTALGIFSTITWETMDVLWQVFSTQPFTDLPGGLSRFSREPTKCLIEGMQSRRLARDDEANVGPTERIYYAHFAFAEMALVAATDAERRKAIFRDVGSVNGNLTEGGSRSAWAAIAQECLKVLEQECLCVRTKGRQTGAATTAVVPPQSLAHLKPIDASHRALVEEGQSVVKRGQASVWDRLASGMPPAAPTQAPAKTTPTAPGSSDPNGLASIFHRLAPAPLDRTTKPVPSPSTAAHTTARAGGPAVSISSTFASFLVASTAKLCNTIFVLLPPDLRHVLSRLPLLRSLPFAQERFMMATNQTLLFAGKVPHEAALATWSIQTLSALLSASIDQDEYGTIALSSSQKLGVDDVLEGIADLLLALSQWGQEIAREMEGEREGNKQDLALLWDRRVAPIVVASRTAISLVLGVFEPTGFRLRPSAQAKVDLATAAGQRA